MIHFQSDLPETEKILINNNHKELKPYFRPCLHELGELRGVTLGPSPGEGESGDPVNFLA